MKKSVLIFSLLFLVCSFPINSFGECIKGDCENGKGTFTFPDGRKYVGEFREGKKHGQGTFTFPNGRQYIGEYRKGKKHGQGTFTFPDGKKYVGKFKDGEYVGK